MEALYGDVDNIDVWVGALAEDHVAGASVGELVQTILVDQFERIRDGDRFWYQESFSGPLLHIIDNTTLADVIERNTEITNLQDHVFFASSSFIFEVQERDRGSDLTLVVNDNTVQIFDNTRHRVLASQSTSEVSQIIIVGVDHQQDRITVQANTSNSSLTNSIFIYGGNGQGDVITFADNRKADEVTIDSQSVVFNELAINYFGFELLRLNASRNDEVVVAEDVDIPVEIEQHQRLQSPKHHQHQPSHPRMTHQHLAESKESDEKDQRQESSGLSHDIRHHSLPSNSSPFRRR